MSYGKVHSSFWTDDKIQALSDAAKLLACYLLSSPHRNAIGCARIPLQYIAADLGWEAKKVSAAVKDLEGIGFITRDADTGWTLINNLMKYDPIKGPKAAIGALRQSAQVPKSGSVYQALYDRLAPIIEAELKDYGAPGERSMQAPSMGDAKDNRSPEPIPFPNQSLSPAVAGIDDDFEEWYAAFPRHEAKGDALKAYRAARAKTDPATLLAGAKRYAAERATEDPKFTKTPGPWLRAEKWLDEPLKASPPPKRSNGFVTPAGGGPIDTSSDGPLAALAAENRRRNKLGLPPMNGHEIAAWRASQSPAAVPNEEVA